MDHCINAEMAWNSKNMSEANTNNDKKNITRRGFIKWTTALAVSGAAVVGIGAGYGADLLLRPAAGTTTTTTTKTTTAPVESLSYKPPLSPEVQARVTEITQDLANRHTGETYVYSHCVQNCMTACLFKVYSKNGAVTSIVADDTVNKDLGREDSVGLDAIKKGQIQSRACAMGYGWKAMAYSPSRVLYPMKLVGAKGSGNYTRITWTEALDTIYRKMKDAKDNYGPNSILTLTFGNKLLSNLIQDGVETWGDQSNSGNQPAEMIAEGTSGSTGPGASSQADIFNSKLVILMGRLPPQVEGQGGTWGYVTLLAKENGVKFISIDPRYTVSAQALNAQWIPIKVGTDEALLLAMADVILKDKLFDQNAIDTWIEPTGWKMWVDYVTGVSDGQEKTPEWAESITGVPAETIRSLTQLYAQNKPSKLHLGWEMDRSASLNISRTAVLLQAMMGYLLIPGGGGPFEMGYAKNPWMAGPTPFPGISAFTFIPTAWQTPTGFNITKWQKAILLREKLDAGQITQAEFNGAIGMKADATPVNIKVVTFPSAMKNHAIDIFGASERIQAIKKVFSWGLYWYIDSTARYMDILLPAVERFLEEPGEGLAAFGGAENRFNTNGSSMNNYFMYASPAMEPLGESRPEEWVWTMLAKRFGVDQNYNPIISGAFGTDAWDWGTWNSIVEDSHKKAYEEWAALPAVAPLSPPSWDQFKLKPVWRYDAVTVGPYASWVDSGKNPFQNTTSQKIEPYADLLSSPQKAATTLWGQEYGYTGACFGKIGSGAGPIPKWVDNLEYTVYDPKGADYPLTLISPQSYYRSHSSGFRNPLLHGDCYRHAVWISVADAKARGINDGDLARIYSDVGEMVIPAYVTSRILPGTVAVYHGGFYTPGGTKTDLMPDGVDRGGAPNLLIEDVQPGKMVNGPDIGSGPVQVEKF